MVLHVYRSLKFDRNCMVCSMKEGHARTHRNNAIIGLQLLWGETLYYLVRMVHARCVDHCTLHTCNVMQSLCLYVKCVQLSGSVYNHLIDFQLGQKG